jgi:hypothetical protein
MSDYFSRLAARTLGQAHLLQPPIQSFIAPGPRPAPPGPLTDTAPEVTSARHLPPALSTRLPSSRAALPQATIDAAGPATARAEPSKRFPASAREEAAEAVSVEPRPSVRPLKRPRSDTWSYAPPDAAQAGSVSTVGPPAPTPGRAARTGLPVRHGADFSVRQESVRSGPTTAPAKRAQPVDHGAKPEQVERRQTSQARRRTAVDTTRDAAPRLRETPPLTSARPLVLSTPGPSRAAATSSGATAVTPNWDTATPRPKSVSPSPSLRLREALTGHAPAEPGVTRDSSPPTAGGLAGRPHEHPKPADGGGDISLSLATGPRAGPSAERALVPAVRPEPGRLPDEAADSRQPVVKVTIGRIEVRSAPASVARPEVEPPRFARPRVTLKEYLERRARR